MGYTITDACIGCLACQAVCPSQAITGEKKNQHKIDEALCIDCGACGRVCPVGAVKDPSGLATEKIKKKDWERPWFDLDTCISCNICLDTCPVGALDANMQKVGSRHLFPWLARESLCMACAFCALDCPVGAITMGPRQSAPVTQKK